MFIAYRTPNLPIDQCKILCGEILEVKNKYPKSHFWLAGDFNLPDIDWNSLEISNSPQYSRSMSELFTTLALDLGVEQVVKDPTREGSILDLFFTNNRGAVSKSSVVAGVSDHHAALIESKLSVRHQKPQRRTILQWNKADVSKMKQDAKNFSSLFLATHKNSDVHSMWPCIKKNLLTILEDNVPSKTTSSKVWHPWVTFETKRLIRNKQILFQKAKSRNTDQAWQKFKACKKLVQKQCRKSHEEYVSDLFTPSNDCSKKFWTYIGKMRKEKSDTSDLFHENSWVTDLKSKADIFNSQFCKVFSNPDPNPSQYSNRHPSRPVAKQMNTIRVNRQGVLKLLQNINEHKATGPDGIPGKLLKILAPELSDIFTVLFQTSLNQGAVPEDWRLAHIIPVFKKGDRSKAENYRPISLTSICCKLLEHIIHSSIMDFLDANSILSDFQHGFRHGRSCESQLITTLRDFSNCLNQSSQVDAILLDFSKAFDKVDHQILLSKMEDIGITGPLLSWTSSFLLNRTQHVLLNGSFSDPAKVLSGVPQGTVMGPLLFLIYINDIHRNLSPGTEIRLFADDSLLYRNISDTSDSQTLQKDLDTLQKWELENKMEFHPDKCQVLTVTNKKNRTGFTYNIHGIPLKPHDTAKYLGVTIDKSLNWDAHLKDIYRKASFMLSFLERNLQKVPQHVKIQSYNALFRPLLEYGCCAWDPHTAAQIDKLELIHKRAARFVTGNRARIHGASQANMAALG